MIVQSIFEIVMVALVICGLVFESKIADWEKRFFVAIKKKFNEHKASARREKFVVISNDYR